MNTSRTSAPRASSKSRAITRFQEVAKTAAIIATSFLLWSCASGPGPVFVPSGPVTTTPRPGDDGSLPPSITQSKSRWVPVRWSDLPGFDDDRLFEAWNAWLKSCERPGATFAPLCGDVRRLSIASPEEQRAWMTSRLQPYRVESLNGPVAGQLTSYYEPLLKASRQQGPGYEVPLYRTPAGLGTRKPWYSRQEIDTLPEARAALRGREIAWLADPVDAMSLHIQGSGRIAVLEPDGSQRVVRVAFAGTNDQPFRSPTQWLTERGVRIGAPVWLASRGSVVNLQRLVFAQDTGSAIVGAVRADYFAGTGFEAGEFASRMNQPLQLWVLWPK